jgi:hypothetical protein
MLVISHILQTSRAHQSPICFPRRPSSRLRPAMLGGDNRVQRAVHLPDESPDVLQGQAFCVSLDHI